MTGPTDAPPSPDGETHTGHSKLASAIERGIFASRWLLAPMYLELAVSLLLLLGKFVQETVELARHTGAEDGQKLITGILSLVDLSLMGNLLVMVMFAGYENFVSRFGEVTKGNQLEDFMHVAEIDNRELGCPATRW